MMWESYVLQHVHNWRTSLNRVCTSSGIILLKDPKLYQSLSLTKIQCFNAARLRGLVFFFSFRPLKSKKHLPWTRKRIEPFKNIHTRLSIDLNVTLAYLQKSSWSSQQIQQRVLDWYVTRALDVESRENAWISRGEDRVWYANNKISRAMAF